MFKRQGLNISNMSLYKIIFILSLITGLQGLQLYEYGTGFRYLTKKMASYIPMSNLSVVQTKWIEQPLDHFNNSETRKWNMRYFENLQYWKPNGTIYLYIGGEGEASPAVVLTGLLYDLAKETDGAMFGSEHRYYGKSIPLQYNETTENLKYLSSRQALADLSNLLQTIRSSEEFKESTNSKVVVVGCSYAGNLAAWMRLLYPNQVDAAIASSAPILAKKDFYEYLETVSDDYKRQGLDGCHDKIAEIFERYNELFKTADGIEQLKREENICEENDMTKIENRQEFFMDKATPFIFLAQEGTPQNIEDHCTILMNNTRAVLNFQKEENNCTNYDFYKKMNDYKNFDWYVSWFYQTCTEFGFYQTTNSDNQPFTKNVPLDIYLKMCTFLFGRDLDEDRIDEGVSNTNNLYSGLKPNVTQVVFVNGDMDPWSRLGALQNVSDDAPAKVIHLASHCKDLYPSSESDSDELKEAREYEKNLIKKWIGFGDYKS